MSQPDDVNVALMALGVAVPLWCAALSAYGLWSMERQSRLSSKSLMDSFEAELISAGRKMRAARKP